MGLRDLFQPASHEELAALAVGVIHRRVQRGAAVVANLVDLGAVRAEPHQQQPGRDPRLHRVHARPTVATQRRVEAHLLVQPFVTERGQLGLGPLELRPGGGHRGLP